MDGDERPVVRLQSQEMRPEVKRAVGKILRDKMDEEIESDEMFHILLGVMVIVAAAVVGVLVN